MEGLNLMLIGMGIVFTFLVVLVILMKLIPIISEKKGKNKKVVMEESVSKMPQKANKVIPESDDSERVRERARTVAAITAAITATVGKRPEKIFVTTPTGETTGVYSSWSYAGRQDLMEVGDLQGQRGFEW
jgi:sodium pump decarboxylase gamma subunit